MKKHSYGILVCALCTLAAILTFGSDNNRITPGFEWATGMYLVNFYSLMQGTNPYYDSIHVAGKFIPKNLKA